MNLKFKMLLTQHAWVKLRIPYFNSFSYRVGGIITTLIFIVASVMFLKSAASAKTSIEKWADPAAGHVMMKLVRTSGGLMLAISILGSVASRMIFNPVSSVIWFSLFLPAAQWNSLLQIDSFEPAGGAVRGPFLALFQQVCELVASMTRKTNRFDGLQSHEAVFSKFAREGEPAVEDHDDGRGWHGEKKGNPYKIKVAPDPGGAICDTACLNSQNMLPPCQRFGMSLAMLESFANYYQVTPEMTTLDVCESFIKPFTKQRECVYQDLLVDQEQLPDGWLGKTTHFVSHWWGYKFLDVLQMLSEHSARLASAGKPMPYYFFDAFTINQHTFFLGSTGEAATHQALIDGLRDRLVPISFECCLCVAFSMDSSVPRHCTRIALSRAAVSCCVAPPDLRASPDGKTRLRCLASGACSRYLLHSARSSTLRCR